MPKNLGSLDSQRIPHGGERPAAKTLDKLKKRYLEEFGRSWEVLEEKKVVSSLWVLAKIEFQKVRDSKDSYAEAHEIFYRKMRWVQLKILARERESARLVALDLDRRKALMTEEDARRAEANAEVLHGVGWRECLRDGE